MTDNSQPAARRRHPEAAKAKIAPGAPTLSKSDEKRNRDDRGLFQPGHALAGPGRPKGSTGYDLRALAEAKSVEAGVDMASALWDVVKALFDQAKAGDTAAAKLLFDKLCVADALALQGAVTLRVVSGVPSDEAP